MRQPLILVASKGTALRQELIQLLRNYDFEVSAPSESKGLVQSFRNRTLDLVIMFSPEGEGVPKAGENRMSGSPERAHVIHLIANNHERISGNNGAVDDIHQFKQSLPAEGLLQSIDHWLSRLIPRTNFPNNQASHPSASEDSPMVGNSPPIQEIKGSIQRTALTDSNVLITGETGTGKEMVAELIHRNSPRHGKPLVCINCAALPDSLLESELFGHERGAFTGADSFQEGKLKAADGGTVFFDEIGDMSPQAQAKILRVIETKQAQRLGTQGSFPLDIRIIAATNRDVDALAKANEFRRDLYFRLNVVRLELPPLRERKDDIPLLLNHYIREMNRCFGCLVEGFTQEAFDLLLHYDWPGNIRELKNLLEAIFVNLPQGRISLKDFPEPFRRHLVKGENCSQSERDKLLATLLATNWNKSKTAQELHWSRMTVYRKIAKYRIHRSAA
ncbi:MAG: sigma-54 dependent transcriptional regulator [Acidobacteriia bacterium]|nr:sigma-54 dependent transcriptional regulator [Terriglobia bacterium]